MNSEFVVTADLQSGCLASRDVNSPNDASDKNLPAGNLELAGELLAVCIEL